MCKRCAEQHNDPRMNAFQPFVQVEWLRMSELQKAEAGDTGYVETKIVPQDDSGLAELKTLEATPGVAGVKAFPHIITLN